MKNYLVIYKNKYNHVIEVPVMAKDEDEAIRKANVRVVDVSRGEEKYHFKSIEAK